MFGRDQQIDMTKHAAPRFVEHEIAQGPVPGNECALFPQGVAGRRRDASDNHIADFALGMTGNHVNCLCAAHGSMTFRTETGVGAG